MSDLNDPRVLYAAERTLLAWNRTASGLMALGFLIDRGSLMSDSPGAGRTLAWAIGIAFVILGVLLNLLSIVQYRRSLADIRPVEIPPGYWVNLAVFTSLAVAILGFLLAFYLIKA
jgi:putative membrane protein